MKRNGHHPAPAHLVPVYPPAAAREVEPWEPVRGLVECAVCLDHYDPRWEGQDPSPERTPLCERCWRLHCHLEAA